MEFFEKIILVVISGWIGNKITKIFQEKAFHNQQKIKNAEAEMERLTAISTRLIQAVSKRRFALQNLIYALITTKNIEKDDPLRVTYREAVQSWNLELQLLLLELSSLSLEGLANRLEYSVQGQFYLAHKELNFYLNNQGKDKLSYILNKISDRLNQVYASTKEINTILIKEAHNKKEEILNGDTEELSTYNLNKASNWTLLVAIFHSTPNILRVPRSS